MRTASICLSGLFLATLLAACATSDPPTQDTAPTDPTPPAATIPAGTGTATATPPPPKQCVTSCTTDSDCQNSCPSESGSVQCCDTATSTCFKSNTSSCPAPPPDDAGSTPTSY